MTGTDNPRPHAPRLMVDLDAASTRYRAALAAPTSGSRAALAGSAADIPALVSEVDRLLALLAQARRRYADLAAAALATLAAHADGEPNPLSYLRDELAHPTAPWTMTGDGSGRGRR